MTFAQEVAACVPELTAGAVRLCRDRDKARDLVQDTVVRALESENQFRPGRLIAWLYVMMRNLFLNGQKRDSFRKRKEGVVSSSAPGVWAGQILLPPDAPWNGKDVREALAAVPEHYADALVKFGVLGWSYEEIRSSIGRPMGTVMSRIHRARSAMEEALP